MGGPTLGGVPVPGVGFILSEFLYPGGLTLGGVPVPWGAHLSGVPVPGVSPTQDEDQGETFWSPGPRAEEALVGLCCLGGAIASWKLPSSEKS